MSPVFHSQRVLTGTGHPNLKKGSGGDAVFSVYIENHPSSSVISRQTKKLSFRHIKSPVSSIHPGFFPTHLFPPDWGLETLACEPNQPPPVFVSQVLEARGPCPVHLGLSVAALAQCWWSWGVAAQTRQPAKPKIPTAWPFTENRLRQTVPQALPPWMCRMLRLIGDNGGCRGRKHCTRSQGIACTWENEACLGPVEWTMASDVRELSPRLQAVCRRVQRRYTSIININEIQLRKRKCSSADLNYVGKSFTRLCKNYHVSLCAGHFSGWQGYSISQCQIVCLCWHKAVALLCTPPHTLSSLLRFSAIDS